MYKDIRRSIYSQITDADELERLYPMINDVEIAYAFNQVTTLRNGVISVEVALHLPKLRMITGYAGLLIRTPEELERWLTSKQPASLQTLKLTYTGNPTYTENLSLLEVLTRVITAFWKPNKQLHFMYRGFFLRLSVDSLTIAEVSGNEIPTPALNYLLTVIDPKLISKLVIETDRITEPRSLKDWVHRFTQLQVLEIKSSLVFEWGDALKKLTPTLLHLEIPYEIAHWFMQNYRLLQGFERSHSVRKVVLTRLMDIEFLDPIIGCIKFLVMDWFTELTEILLMDVDNLNVYVKLNNKLLSRALVKVDPSNLNTRDILAVVRLAQSLNLNPSSK